MCVFCASLFVLLCFFSFGHCVVCSSSMNVFWLFPWCLQTLLTIGILPFLWDFVFSDHVKHTFLLFYVIILWVLMKAPMARPKELPSMSSMLPILCVLSVGCQVIVQNARQWTILGIVLEECTLKTSFVDFEKKEYVHCSFFQTLIAFPPTLFSNPYNPYTAYIRSELSLPKKRSEMCPMYKCVMYKTTFQDGMSFLWVCNGMKVLLFTLF